MKKGEILKSRFEKILRDYLEYLGMKKEEVLENTPRRFAKFLEEFTLALREEYKDFKVFKSEYNQMVTLETTFYSLCEHHLLPFFGKVFVAYLPRTEVIGVSKIVKLVKHLARKPTLQEELTEEIAKEISKRLDVAGVAVCINAFHLCVATRYKEGWLLTTSLGGVFKHNPFAKQEFLDYIKNRLEVRW